MRKFRFSVSHLAALAAVVLSVAPAPASTIVSSTLFSFGSSGSSDGQFSFPQAIAINSTNGLIYVSDTNNNRVQIFSSTGTFVGKWGSSGSGNGQFSGPGGLAINQTTGDVYVADYGNNRIQRFSSLGAYLGQWGTFGTGNGQFSGPNGLAVQPSTGNVYVSEFAGNRVQYFNSAGVFVGKFSAALVFSSPGALAIDPVTEDVLVAEYNGLKVQRFSSTGTFQTSWTTKGTTAFNQPAGVAVDDSGHIIVPDRSAPIPVFNGTGSLLGGFSKAGSGSGQYASAYGVATGPNGLVVVSDSSLDRVIAWRLSTINQKPVVKITGKAKVTTTKSSLLLHGTATDADGTIKSVLVKVGKNAAKPAKFANGKWTFKVSLAAGKNSVVVTAKDAEGGTSKPAKAVILRQ